MILKKFHVRSFGEIERLDVASTASVAVFVGRACDTVAAAIDLLCGVPLDESDALWREDSRVFALFQGRRRYAVTVCGVRPCLRARDPDSGGDVTDEFLRAVRACDEERAMRCFSPCSMRRYPKGLVRYYRAPPCEEDAPLKKHTDGLVDRAAFRACVRRFIRAFDEEPLRFGKPYRLTLGKDGAFCAVHPECPEERLCLSETEQVLFSFLCFLHLAKFWDEVNAERDLHHEAVPLMIRGFAERLDASYDPTPLIERACEDEEQALLFLPCASDVGRLAALPSLQTIFL